MIALINVFIYMAAVPVATPSHGVGMHPFEDTGIGVERCCSICICHFHAVSTDCDWFANTCAEKRKDKHKDKDKDKHSSSKHKKHSKKVGSQV